MNRRETDKIPEMPSGGDQDRRPVPVTAKGVDYAPGYESPMHRHPTAQLVHAMSGVMVVTTPSGQWVVPPSRGIWVPATTPHSIRTVGPVLMRSLFVWPDAAPGLPTRCEVVAISPLLRELILAAVDIPPVYELESRDGRLMRLVLDELSVLPVLPLKLPQPRDSRLAAVCEGISRTPEDNATLADWGRRVGADPKTLQRLFARETGMSFGQWRQQARLLIGLEQLAAGKRVVDVALNLGYESPSAFASMFKRQFGETPSRFFGSPA